MVPCGRPKCSWECRGKWARKHAHCANRSFLHLPPTHHLVLHPPEEMSEAAFSKLIGQLLAKLKRWLGVEVEYIRIFEWKSGRVHAHLWLRTTADIPAAVVSSLLPPGVRVSCKPRRGSITAVARYLFKAVRNAKEKTQLPPQHFRGKLFVASRGFFVRPIKQLWKEVKAEWRAKALLRERPS